MAIVIACTCDECPSNEEGKCTAEEISVDSDGFCEQSGL